MRVFLPLLLMTLCGAFVRAEERPRVIINVHADVVEYDHELGTVAIQGQVQLTAKTDAPGYPSVSMTADQVEGDVRQGRIIAHGGVKMLSQQVALRGEKVSINLKTDEFVMENGAASVDQPSQQYPGSILRGYFFGDQICRQAEVIFVIEGRLTTCDRKNPHYFIGARKITYNMTKRTMRIDRANVSLYGLRVTFPMSITMPVGHGRRQRTAIPIPLIPSFSSDDGLYWNVPFKLGGAEDEWQVGANLRLGTKLRLPFTVQAVKENERGIFTGMVTYREVALWDINERSRINRLPEVHYLRHLRPPADGMSRLDMEVFAGHIQESDEGVPSTEATRAGVSLRYSPMPWQRRDRRGWWWAAAANQNFYSTGDRLTDLQLELGAGGQLTDRLGAAVWGVHHETSGQSPFLFDDVYTENEAYLAIAAGLTRNYSLEAIGRYDFERERLRDYTLKLSRRVHCLTWNVEYNFARGQVQLGVDLNGLTGDTRPPDTAPLVSPDEVPPLPEPVPAAEPVTPQAPGAGAPAGGPIITASPPGGPDPTTELPAP